MRSVRAKGERGIHERGFTLVEMIVSVALFAIVMLIAIGALLSVIEANRKAVAMQSVINNLNVAVDEMVRSLRQGTIYRCGGQQNSSSPRNCTGGQSRISFNPFDGNPESTSDDWVYFFGKDENKIGRIYRSENNRTDEHPLTAPEVSIESVTFYVVGATRAAPDELQPKVMIVIKGTAGVKGKTNAESSFHIQATAVQRLLDL
ncbi:MAG TPA: type II secretion system protein [Candidatus Paceibacterota bacterium]